MKTSGPRDWPKSLQAAAIVALLLFAGGTSAQAQFHAGNVLTTNLAFQNRILWTNDNGQVFTPSNTVLHLSDFAGKIVFFMFFDEW